MPGIKLNPDSTYQATNLPSLVDICQQGTFRIEDLPDDYHLVNFSCEQSHRQVYFNPDGDQYQIIFNADRTGTIKTNQGLLYLNELIHSQ